MIKRSFYEAAAQTVINLNEGVPIEPQSPLHRDMGTGLVDAINERDRLRAINAELLEALKWAAPIVDHWFKNVDSNRGTKAQNQGNLDAMHAAIAKAEASK